MKDHSDLINHYRKKREKLYNAGKLPRMILIRKCLHPLMISAVKIARKIAKQKLVVVCDNRNPQREPCIYACSHIGWDDIQMTFEAIRSHAWLFWGNPEYRTPHYYVLMANGAVCLDSYNKTDRSIAKNTAIKLLKQGQSLLIYPEGAWNITTNLPVMKLFPGTAEIAITAGVNIVPVGIVQNGLNEYYVSIGKKIQTKGYDIKEKYQLTEILRDSIATQVWYAMETLPVTRRENISSNAEQEFKDFLTSQMNNAFSLEDCDKERYHDKSVTDKTEAFLHLDNLIPSKANAFLFDKRLK